MSLIVQPVTLSASASRVLLVEDELLIRLLVADDLRESGFEVVEACSGDEAIEILRAGAQFDVVLSDVRMPGVADGMELLRYIRRSRPTLPVILTSGHLDADTACSAGAAQFLPKPCALNEVVAAIKAALGAQA